MMAAVKRGIATCAKRFARSQPDNYKRARIKLSARLKIAVKLVESFEQNHYQCAAKSAVNVGAAQGRGVEAPFFSQRPKMGMIFDSPRNGELDGRPRACS